MLCTYDLYAQASKYYVFKTCYSQSQTGEPEKAGTSYEDYSSRAAGSNDIRQFRNFELIGRKNGHRIKHPFTAIKDKQIIYPIFG